MHIRNQQVKPGFVFIPADRTQLPASYLVRMMGEYGYYGKLDPESVTNWVPVSVQEYDQA